MIIYRKKNIFISLISILIILTQFAHASVILIGTRVIYPEDKKFINLNFSSSDAVPSIMDVWITKSPLSSSNRNDAPFILTPPIFRIDPNKGQSIKLMYTGDANLPKDRESVFYLNFLQLPAVQKDTNKLVFTFKSIVKIFYRPRGLKQNVDNISSFIKVDTSKLNKGTLTILNNSEYFITPSKLTLEKNGENILSISAKDLNMIAPFSDLKIKIKPTNNSNITAKIDIINDLGGTSTYKIK